MTVRERESFSIHHRTREQVGEKTTEAMKEKKSRLSAVSSCSEYDGLTSRGKATADVYLAALPAHSYLQGLGVHNVLHEAVHRNPHNAPLGEPLVHAHRALPDLVLHMRHKDLLVAVLYHHMELRGDVHRERCLPRMEHPVVGFLLLDSPEVMETLNNNVFVGHFTYSTC